MRDQQPIYRQPLKCLHVPSGSKQAGGTAIVSSGITMSRPTKERERQQKDREDKAKAAQAETSSEDTIATTSSTDQIAEDDGASKPIPHLIIGSELDLTDGAGEPFCTLVALAIDCNGCGNLSELITLAHLACGQRQLLLKPVGLYRLVASSRASERAPRLRADARAAAYGDALAHAAV